MGIDEGKYSAGFPHIANAASMSWPARFIKLEPSIAVARPYAGPSLLNHSKQ